MTRGIQALFATSLASALALAPAGSVRADENNDISVAQDCLNHEKGRNTLRCIRGIQHYKSDRAYLLRCDAKTRHQGWSFMASPWLMSVAPEGIWTRALNSISDLDLDSQTAESISKDCFGTGKHSFLKVLGYYYELRAALLTSTTGDDERSLQLWLGETHDFQNTQKVSRILQSIQGVCRNEIDELGQGLIYCIEILKLPAYPGASTFEQFRYSAQGRKPTP